MFEVKYATRIDAAAPIITSSNLREKVKVIVGGAPVTEDWARQIGADAYGRDAFEAVRKVKMLLGEEGSA